MQPLLRTGGPDGPTAWPGDAAAGGSSAGLRLFAPRGHRPPLHHLAAYCAAQSATPPATTPAAATAAATPPALATSGGTATKPQGCRDPGQWRYEVGLGDATVRHGGRRCISVLGLPPLACMPCAPSAPRAHRARAAAGREQSHFASGDLLAAKIATDASAAKATGGSAAAVRCERYAVHADG